MDSVVDIYDLSEGQRLARLLGTSPSNGGWGVNALGDINNDGFADYAIHEEANGVWRSVIVYGSDIGRSVDRYLADLPGPIINEVDPGDGTGRASAAGSNISGGGTSLVLAAPFADPLGDADNPVSPGAGAIYVVNVDDLSPGENSADAPFVITITGVDEDDYAGWSVDTCDINGDSFDDIVIGAMGVDENGAFCGAVYIVYGSADPLPLTIDLADLDGTNGGKIVGLAGGDRCGWSVANLGDVNGDGIDDCILSSPNADPGGKSGAGECYVIFGSASGIFNSAPPMLQAQGGNAIALALMVGEPGTFDLNTLDGTNGFRIVGADASNYAGRSVSSAGDINGDGFNDIIIGADGVDLDGSGFYSHGAAYVIYGTDAGFDATLNLADLDGTNGFRLHGDPNGRSSQAGYSVASAGDFNGDGYDDLLIGAIRARSEMFGPPHGAVYIVFGSAAPFAADFNLATLDGQNGFRINGAEAGEYLGSTVASIGDVDGDGFDDIAIIGLNSEATYIVYGQATQAVGILGTPGDDSMTGGSGNDFFDVSQGGADTVSGLGGDDGFYFGAALTAADSVDGGAGDDQLGLQGHYAGFVLGAGNLIGIETLVLLPGNDTRFGDPGTNLYSYDITTVDANVAAGQRLIVNFNTLRAGEDVMFDGSAETDGSFLTYAGLGNDTLTGGAQDDGFYFGNGGRWGAGDSVDGGAGNDQLGLQGSYTIVFGAAQLTSIETIVLLTGGDARFGNPAGTGYSYDLTMHDGNVAAGQTLIVNANTLRANQPGVTDETLTFDGAAELDGHFTVYSGAGDDTITGGAGNDTICGAGGADTLTGGGGNDVFLYMNAAHSTSDARDQILDFTLGDLIDLSAIDADTGAGGNQAFAFIGTAAFSNAAGELRFESAGGANWLVQGDVDGDGAADFEIMVTVTDADPIAMADFVL